MKKTIKLLSFAFFAAAILMSCEGPEGPAGTDGTNGIDGIDGVDGILACLECHSEATMNAITNVFANHKHSEGTSWAYAGTRGYCNPCHDGDSYVEFVRTGNLITGPGMGLECGTCHVNHASLEDDISAPIREVGVVASLVIEGATYDHGAGNLCATCHQARSLPTSYYGDADATYTKKFTGDDIATYTTAAIGPAGTSELIGDTLFVTFDVPLATHVYTSNTHAGPHHGPQANMFAADMGSIQGTAFTRAHHTDCSSCHVSDTTAATGFGHNFEPDMAMCDACHGVAVNITAKQAAIKERMDAVATKLEEIHAIHLDTDGTPHPLYASLPKAQWDAFWNFMCLSEDKSEGVHNFGYADQLLTAAETALGL